MPDGLMIKPVIADDFVVTDDFIQFAGMLDGHGKALKALLKDRQGGRNLRKSKMIFK